MRANGDGDAHGSCGLPEDGAPCAWSACRPRRVDAARPAKPRGSSSGGGSGGGEREARDGGSVGSVGSARALGATVKPPLNPAGAADLHFMARVHDTSFSLALLLHDDTLCKSPVNPAPKLMKARPAKAKPPVLSSN